MLELERPGRRRERVAAGAVAVGRDQRAGRPIDLRDGVRSGNDMSTVLVAGSQFTVFE